MVIPAKDELINKAGDLKVLPFVAKKILEIITDENVSTQDLATIIEKDQTIAARVLKIANSALYGLRHEVTSIQQALLLLGFKTIRSLVLSVSSRALYKHFGMKEKIIWDHSIGAAIAARLVSGGQGSEVEESAFVGGLMHDIGKVVLNNETPDTYGEIIMSVYNEGINAIDEEQEVYGFDHAEIGAAVAAKWGFPEILVQIIRCHHLSSGGLEDVKDPIMAKSIACVHLADNICRELGIGCGQSGDGTSLDEIPSAIFLGLKDDGFGQLLERVSDMYQREKSIFD